MVFPSSRARRFTKHIQWNGRIFLKLYIIFLRKVTSELSNFGLSSWCPCVCFGGVSSGREAIGWMPFSTPLSNGSHRSCSSSWSPHVILSSHHATRHQCRTAPHPSFSSLFLHLRMPRSYDKYDITSGTPTYSTPIQPFGTALP